MLLTIGDTFWTCDSPFFPFPKKDPILSRGGHSPNSRIYNFLKLVFCPFSGGGKQAQHPAILEF
jgi:hypothetical protein